MSMGLKKIILVKIKQIHLILCLKYIRINFRLFGEVSEWFNVHAWKACMPKGIGGSNPLLSAIIKKGRFFCPFLLLY